MTSICPISHCGSEGHSISTEGTSILFKTCCIHSIAMTLTILPLSAVPCYDGTGSDLIIEMRASGLEERCEHRYLVS